MPRMSVGEKIREARRARGMTQTDLGKILGVRQSVVSEMEAGKLKNWPIHAAAIVRALGRPRSFFEPESGDDPVPTPPVSVAPRLKDIARRIPVVGDVEAGVWRETVAREAYEIDEYLPLDVQGYESARLRALRVVGPSMNKHYPPGRFVVVADPAEAGVRDGDHVIVERRKGSLTEITLKEYVEEADGRIALWPRSDHPDFQEPIYLRARDDSDQDGASIIGVVVADYRRRERPAV